MEVIVAGGVMTILTGSFVFFIKSLHNKNGKQDEEIADVKDNLAEAELSTEKRFSEFQKLASDNKEEVVGLINEKHSEVKDLLHEIKLDIGKK